MYFKRALVYFLLITFIINLIGCYPLFLILKYNIRRQVKTQIINQLSEDKIISIAFDSDKNEQPDWVIRGKEFVFKNQFYDVVEIVSQGKITVFRCFDDKKETRLVAFFKHQANTRIRNVLTSIYNHLDILKFLVTKPQFLYFNYSCLLRLINNDVVLHSRFVESDTPPPEI